MTPSVSIDTSVLVEYVDEFGDFHSQAKVVFEKIISSKLTGLITHPVFAELYYVSYRLYEKVYSEKDVHSTQTRSENLINWLFKSPNMLMPENTIGLAIEAGKIKQKFSMALPDSYVIASAKMNRCRAIFRSPEEEMSHGNKLARLKREENVDIVFLEDYK